MIRKLRGTEEIQGFHSLIALVEEGLFRTSINHLTPLINLISAIVEGQGTEVQKLDKFAIS